MQNVITTTNDDADSAVAEVVAIDDVGRLRNFVAGTASRRLTTYVAVAFTGDFVVERST